MKCTIDASSMTDRQTAHRILKEALSLPDWYGNNLDALYDLATAMKVEVCLIHVGALRTQLGTYGEKLIATLQDAAGKNPGFTLYMEE